PARTRPGRVAFSPKVDQPVLADLELVAVAQRRPGLDPPAVEEGAIEAPLVLDHELVVAPQDHGVLARDGDVVEEDVALGRAADRRALAGEAEALPRAAAAGADDERGPVGGDLLERRRRVAL